jgi:hypothetical protein
MGQSVLHSSSYTVSRGLRKQIVILIYPYLPMDAVLLGRHSGTVYWRYFLCIIIISSTRR